MDIAFGKFQANEWESIEVTEPTLVLAKKSIIVLAQITLNIMECDIGNMVFYMPVT